MSGEIEVSETPNWLQELEAKRERRVKARLGHETGAGAPCLKCGDKCPGLDLHFWRKCCKICKCSKEEHEVQDDDIYGWAQFQLLGNKPNKIKRKIVLPGKKDEVELDWAPTGHKETVDKYLKTLPPEQLPVKGSQAAQDRKQLLQKQIPIHDIDPTLCHELTNDELKQMNDYISHVKQMSVGVGQIVSLSSIIKGNLHTLNPSEAAIIASRYAKGVPLSEIVKLQSQDRASLLRSQGLHQKMGNLSVGDRNLPNFVPNAVNTTEHNVSPLVANKIHDVNYPGYTRDVNQTMPTAQYSRGLKPGQYKGLSSFDNQKMHIDPTIDEKYLQNPNFDPKNIPSQFISQNPQYAHSYAPQGEQNRPYDLAGYRSGEGSSAFVPYNKISSGFRSGENYVDDIPSESANFASRLPGRDHTQGVNPQQPGFAQNRGEDQNMGFYGDKVPYDGVLSVHNARIDSQGQGYDEDVAKLTKNAQGLPNYAPGKYNVHSNVQSPTKMPKNFRDLAFSTYDPDNVDPTELGNKESDPRYSTGLSIPYETYPGSITGSMPGSTMAISQDYNLKPGRQFGQQNLSYQNPTGLERGPYGASDKNSKGLGAENTGIVGKDGQFDKNTPYGQNSSGSGPFGAPKEGHYPADHGTASSGKNFSQKSPGGKLYDQNAPGSQYSPSSSTGTAPSGSRYNQMSPGGTLYDQNAPGSQCGQPGSTGTVPGGGRYHQMSPGGTLYDQNAPGSQYSQPGSTDTGPGGGRYKQMAPEGTLYNQNAPGGQYGQPDSTSTAPGGGRYNQMAPEGTLYDQNAPGSQYGQPGSTETVPSGGRYNQMSPGGSLYNQNAPGSQFGQSDSIGTVPGGGRYNQMAPEGTLYDQNALGGQYGPQNLAYENYPPGFIPGNNDGYPGKQFGASTAPYGTKKKLSELHPGQLSINEDFLQPSQVKIGAIQDINYPEIKAATHGTNDFYEDYSPDSLREILNNIKLPDCHYCKKPFEENEFAITIDRANVLFHAECFKCAGCNQILADNVYFYNKETDNIYCGRDYAKIRGFPRCKACDELIFTKEYCLAENSTFHLKHFCCIECDRPLAGQDYTLEDEMPYCLPCFEQSKASKCSACFRVIKPDEIGCNLNGVHFHAVDECFACKMCKKPLMGKKLLLRNEKLYCSHDCFGADK